MKYPSYQTSQRLLLSGFDLIWSVECRDCESAGGLCYVDSYGEQYNNYDCIKKDTSIHVVLSVILSLLASSILGIISSLLEIFLLLLCWLCQYL
ncbi:hypothetical protein ACOSQ2_020009 [Xanthoceras sorbifolium]